MPRSSPSSCSSSSASATASYIPLRTYNPDAHHLADFDSSDMADHAQRVNVDDMTPRERLSVRGVLAGLPRLPTREQRKSHGSMKFVRASKTR